MTTDKPDPGYGWRIVEPGEEPHPEAQYWHKIFEAWIPRSPPKLSPYLDLNYYRVPIDPGPGWELVPWEETIACDTVEKSKDQAWQGFVSGQWLDLKDWRWLRPPELKATCFRRRIQPPPTRPRWIHVSERMPDEKDCNSVGTIRWRSKSGTILVADTKGPGCEAGTWDWWTHEPDPPAPLRPAWEEEMMRGLVGLGDLQAFFKMIGWEAALKWAKAHPRELEEFER